MKKSVLTFVAIAFLAINSFAQVAINETGASPSASAILDISSDNKGLLIPRMSTNDRTTSVVPVAGLLVYDTDTDSFWYFDNQWIELVTDGSMGINGLSDGIADVSSVFLGDGSGDSDNTNNLNSAVGKDAMHLNTSGMYNTAIGHSAMRNNTIGNYNTAIGRSTNYYNQEGSNNTIVGYRAGMGTSNHNKSGNIFLGYQAGYNETSSNKLYIHNSSSSTPLIYGDFSTNVLGFMGDVGIGTKAPLKNLHILGSPTLASVLVSPQGNTNNDSEILLAEDDDFTYGMSIKYDGGDNRMYFYGKTEEGFSSPYLTIERGGNVGVGISDPSELFHVVSTGNKRTSYFQGGGLGVLNATIYAENIATTGGIAGYFETNGTDACIVLKQNGIGKFLKAFGPDGGNEEWNVSNDGFMEFYNSDHNRTITIDPSESGSADAGQITLYSADGTTATIEIDGGYSGDGRITTNELQITGGSDLSEFFELSDYDFIEKGMVVSIDENNPGQLKICKEDFDKKVAGIVSGANHIKPGLIMSQKGTIADGEHLVALSGRVYCMVDATQNPIEIGDMLTTSSTPGHAMKVDDFGKAQGAIIGKAMTSLKSGKGLVLILVSLQ